MKTLIALFALCMVGCTSLAPIGPYTVLRRTYETECIANIGEPTPWEASALVHDRVIRLGECAVPLAPDGSVEGPVTCFGPNGNPLYLTSGKYNRTNVSLTMTGRIDRLSSLGEPKSCPVTFTVLLRKGERDVTETVASRGR